MSVVEQRLDVTHNAAPPAATRTALKEWAVACEALGRGEQILLLRKGGISEEHKEFRVEHPDFLLFPTYEHQQPDLLKPSVVPDFERVQAERGPTNRVQLRYWASATAAFEVRQPEQLEAISTLHLWSDAYALERLRWRPVKPLQAVALRVYRLPEAISILLLPEYGGCKSWLSLAQPIVLEGVRPVLEQQAFDEQLAQIRRLLGSQPEEFGSR